MTMKVRLGKLELRSPIALASGILCNGPLLKVAATVGGAGAVVTKSLTREAREGYPTPVIVGVKAGLINAVGLANPGYQYYLLEELPIAKEGGAPVIVSAAAGKAEEFVEICSAAEEAGADAMELNMSCPHVERYGMEIGGDPSAVRRIVKELKGILKIPVHVKLGLSDNLVRSALAAEEAGADAMVAINTIRAMAIDVDARRPILSNAYGGLSGPAIHPVAIRCVHELHERLDIPIIGCGGVDGWRTAVEFMLAGASAVQVGSAVATRGIGLFKEIERGLEGYLRSNGFKGVMEVVGNIG